MPLFSATFLFGLTSIFLSLLFGCVEKDEKKRGRRRQQVWQDRHYSIVTINHWQRSRSKQHHCACVTKNIVDSSSSSSSSSNGSSSSRNVVKQRRKRQPNCHCHPTPKQCNSVSTRKIQPTDDMGEAVIDAASMVITTAVKNVLLKDEKSDKSN